MKRRPGRRPRALALPALAAFTLLALTAFALVAQPAVGAVIDVKTRAGTPAADVIVVFDPLDATPPPSRESATIDQVNKTFVPHVTVIRTGTAVTFPNSDHIRHQVYSFSDTKKFVLKLYAGSPRTDVTFEKPGLVVLGCNIHDSMVAFVLVVDTPYFAKTSAAGQATVNLPPGRYRLRVWHPRLSTPVAPQDVAVGATALEIPLTVDLGASADDVASWP
jgi:plastocyanin